MSVQTIPAFGIDQRAFLLRTPHGNILWDCIALLDSATEELIRGLGGLRAIAISHPHYYTTMQDWAVAFDAPIFLHAADRDWVARSHSAIRFWESGTLEVVPGATLIHLGGHFPGSSVLHWANAADGAGVLLAGDTVQVAPGGNRVSFMRSYPNMLPLAAEMVREIAERLATWAYDRIYGPLKDREVTQHGKAVVAASAARYVELLGSREPGP
jgi:glyoxylase-like metal-dependent hydrolase (beta-lactamase superfamily II)